ncbi:hypothetical protein [Rathayibacter sp. SD072]|uniref:hypothetical protein n=1 Tax=Rathayibacter sp. SD072 TaxID=2781731 RepID=UPI001A967A7E|nr:hypothetical protein [Rathayibacter sp. SD072]MBO0983939.1 hypothetical protein [Rathayibacter sp. SD072]
MTLVTFDFRIGDFSTGADGSVLLSPIRRVMTDSAIVLPEPFAIPIKGGVGSVELTPNDPAVWAWVAKERVPHGIERVFSVPDSGPVAYGVLPDIDPATFVPNATPPAGWWTELATVDAIVRGALQRETADGADQTVATRVNFAGGLTSGGSTVVTTGATQTLSAKTLTLGTLSGWRQTTGVINVSTTLSNTVSVFLITTTAPIVLTLPPVSAGLTITIKVAVSGTPNVTIQRQGSSAIDGQPTLSLTTGYARVQLTATSSNWFITG